MMTSKQNKPPKSVHIAPESSHEIRVLISINNHTTPKSWVDIWYYAPLKMCVCGGGGGGGRGDMSPPPPPIEAWATLHCSYCFNFIQIDHMALNTRHNWMRFLLVCDTCKVVWWVKFNILLSRPSNKQCNTTVTPSRKANLIRQRKAS